MPVIAPRLTVAERHELGRSARTRLPRSSLADYVAAHDRPDPVALLQTQATTRVAELAPIRYGRMGASPFSFYRGAAAIMARRRAGSHRASRRWRRPPRTGGERSPSIGPALRPVLISAREVFYCYRGILCQFGQANALCPVMCRPTMRDWISAVPS